MSCNPFDECEHFSDNRPTIVLKEKKSKYIGKNNESKNFTSIKVDGCLIEENLKQCDFLLLNCDQHLAYLIELKGSDLLQAIRQIDKSLDKLAARLKLFQSINARIVLTKTPAPDINSTEEIRLKKRLKKMKGNLKRGNSPLEEIL